MDPRLRLDPEALSARSRHGLQEEGELDNLQITATAMDPRLRLDPEALSARSCHGLQEEGELDNLQITAMASNGMHSAHAEIHSTASPVEPGGSPDDIAQPQREKPEAEYNVDEILIPSLRPTDFDYKDIETSEAIKLGYPALNFKPFTLQTWFLVLTLMFFIACVGGIAALIYSAHNEAEHFYVHDTQNYLAFRYVPAAIGTLTTIWYRAIAGSLFRMTPYISMAAPDGSHGARRIIQNDYADLNGVWNLINMAQNRHWLMLISISVLIIINPLMVPLKAAFVQITPNDNGWTVVVLLKIGYALISIYACLIITVTFILIRLWNRDTGVKWDPASVADQIALFQGSNVLPLFDGLEFALPMMRHKILQSRAPYFGTVRLGYWRHKRSHVIWHGVACIPPKHTNNNSGDLYSNYGHQHILDSARYRYRSVMWVLDEVPLLFSASILIVLIALVATGLAKHRVQDGFSGIFTTSSFVGNDPLGKFAYTIKTAFLFRFLPVLIFIMYNFIWLNADVFYRYTTPFASMHDGAPATTSILLDYTSATPILVIVKSIINGHWRVAVCSILSLLSTVPPIVASGIFVSTPILNGIAISISPINFWAMFIWLFVSLFCLITLRPPPKYRLPRIVRTMSDVMSYCYASQILDDLSPDGKPVFSVQEKGDERIHLESRIHLAKKEYQFGLYLDKYGKEHMGFDVAVRDDANGRPVEVKRFKPPRGIHGFGLSWQWRRAKLLKPTA